MAGTLMDSPRKFNREKVLGFSAMVPASPGAWNRTSVKNSETMPEGLDVNELYQALYTHPDFGQVALTLEYTSDSRREFELHYPDVCHGIRGDRIVNYSPARFELSDGRFINAAMMNWQQSNGAHSAVTAYWYVTADGVTTDSMKLKVKQALSGLLSKPENAVMVRFDAFYEHALTPEKRAGLFAAIRALSHDIENEIDSRTKTILYKQFDEETI
jgi:EpsI family protein